MTMQVQPATPPGVYPMIVGAYQRTADGSFDRLQTLANGRLTDDFYTLFLVRVE
jgi:hypothetical protein